MLAIARHFRVKRGCVCVCVCVSICLSICLARGTLNAIIEQPLRNLSLSALHPDLPNVVRIPERAFVGSCATGRSDGSIGICVQVLLGRSSVLRQIRPERVRIRRSIVAGFFLGFRRKSTFQPGKGESAGDEREQEKERKRRDVWYTVRP
jgi:hypothetical protein